VRKTKAQNSPTAGTVTTGPVVVLDVGTTVYVRDRFLGNWCSGFEVAEVLPDGYRLLRLTDHRVFPDVFSFDDVHLERRANPRGEGNDSLVDARRQFP
jgi:hypothetical protein